MGVAEMRDRAFVCELDHDQFGPLAGNIEAAQGEKVRPLFVDLQERHRRTPQRDQRIVRRDGLDFACMAVGAVKPLQGMDSDMRAENAKSQLEWFFRERKQEPSAHDPLAWVDAMVAFYREVRAEDCDLSEDGDMLLFEWGTYDWGQGAAFEYGVSRQMIPMGMEEDEVWQLRPTFRFVPDPGLRSLNSGHRWCSSLDDLPNFVDFVLLHPATTAVQKRQDGVLDLVFDNVE